MRLPVLEQFNVTLMAVSPPDAHGYVNFGDLQIMSKTLSQRAELVLAEIVPDMVRIGGDNAMHISAIDWFVERAPDAPRE